jgi:hypothetical protein
MKNQTTRILLLTLGVLLIAITLYCFYKYLSNSTNTIEKFYTYQAVYTGDPMSNNINNYGVVTTNYTIICSTSNPDSSQLVLLTQNATNNNIAICTYIPNNKKFHCVFADTNNISGKTNFNKINPTTTMPATINNITCNNNNGGYLLSLNSSTIFYYNQNINNQNKVNCLYYYPNITNIPNIPKNTNTNDELFCLALPSITLTNTTPNTTDSSGKINLPYDKLRLLCANDNIIFAMGCTNNLYYYPLTNKVPSNNLSWVRIECPVDPSTVLQIAINEKTVFIYARDTPANTKIMYSVISLSENTLSLSSWNNWMVGTTLTNNPIAPPNQLQKLTANNNVMWAVTTNLSGSSVKVKLWWCPLKNKAPEISSQSTNPYIWKSVDISGITNSIIDMCVYSDILIIYTGNQKLISIPLYNSSRTVTTSASGTATTTAATQTSTTVASAVDAAASGNPATTSAVSTGTSGSGTSGSGTSGSGTSGSGTSGSGTSGSGTSGSGTSGSGTSGSGTSGSGTATTSRSGSGTATTSRSGSGTSGNDTTTSNSSLFGMFGINDNYNNRDNLNDFLSNSSILGNNLYISPMNNSELYNPTKPQIKSKISSSFFPLVKIA